MSSQWPSELHGRSQWRPSGSCGTRTKKWRDFRWRWRQGLWKRRETWYALRRGPLDVFDDSLVVLLVTFLVLIEIIFIRDGSEDSGRLVREPDGQNCCLDPSILLRGLCNKQIVRKAVGGVNKVLVDPRADHRLVTAHVNDDLVLSLGSITVNGLCDARNELFSPEGQIWNSLSKARRSCKRNLSCKVLYLKVMLYRSRCYQILDFTATSCTFTYIWI